MHSMCLLCDACIVYIILAECGDSRLRVDSRPSECIQSGEHSEWTVINLFVANCYHLGIGCKHRMIREPSHLAIVNVNKVDIFTESY